MMKVLILGSAAGGGFPQWNCNCPNCQGVRKGDIQARARTQSSIAISSDGLDWVLINASPDILHQLRANPALQPARGIRDTGIRAVMLMDAQIDHVTGLLMLREGQPFPLYCTASVWNDLSDSLPLAKVLSHYCGLLWNPLPAHGDVHAAGVRIPGFDNINFTPLGLKSKAPPYSPHRNRRQADDNIGLLIEDRTTGKKLFYAPGLAEIEPHIEQAMHMADCILVDGTFWTEDEMIRQGLSKKTAAEMGHLPQSGPNGMIAVLNALGPKRKILIHINNSNPILNEDSNEAALLNSHGIELAFDGMEINL
jgi:pyrroloquinoline quinone biosynthesis protein B